MAIFTEEQRTELSEWRAGLVAVQQKASEASDLIVSLMGADGQALLDGKVNGEDLWTDAGGAYNDLRNELIAAAEAMPEHESG